MDALINLRAALADRYPIQRELGGGSMAIVFLAQDLKHDREVAVKVLRPEFAATLGPERFLREIEVVARLQHPHILPLLDSGTSSGYVYFVMPYIEGDTLRARLAREGPLPISLVIRVLADLADALTYAHGKGIVHRDIKPDNIIMAGRHAIVMDFGVSKAVRAAAVAPLELTGGVALGTPTYMAPEQATADPTVDHRADLYALGVVGYELLAGRPPFTGTTAHEMLTAHVLDDPEPISSLRPDTPVPLAALLMRCLAKKPADRPQSAEHVLAQLEPLATPSGGVTPTGARPVDGAARRWLRWVTAGIAAAALLALGVILARPGGPRVSAPPVQRQFTFDGKVIEAALSPDGQFLAYLAQRGDSSRLMLQEMLGGAGITLAVHAIIREIGWSGDGTELRYVTLTGTTWSPRAIPRLGGAEKVLPGRLAYPAPRGGRTASLNQAGPTIMILGPARSDTLVVPLPPEYGWVYRPTWDWSGERLVVPVQLRANTGWRLVGVDVKGTMTELVLDSMVLSTPVIGPKGRSILYLVGWGDFGRLERQRLTGDFKPTGQRETLLEGIATVYDLGATTMLSGSADGRRVVAVKAQQWSNLERVRIGAGSARPEPLTTGTASNLEAQLSPDGRRLAFIRAASDRVTLNVLNLDGSGSSELGEVSPDASLTWSADGSAIAFSVPNHRGPGGVMVSGVAGGAMLSLPTDFVAKDVAWPAGYGVIYQTGLNRAFRRVRPGDTVSIPIPGISDTAGWVFTPRVSPDERWLAFMWSRARPEERGLWVVSLVDGSARRLAEQLIDPVRWSPDGRVLYIAPRLEVSPQLGLLALSFPDGRLTELARIGPETLVQDISPDGRWAIVRRRERRADAWVLELPEER